MEQPRDKQGRFMSKNGKVNIGTKEKPLYQDECAIPVKDYDVDDVVGTYPDLNINMAFEDVEDNPFDNKLTTARPVELKGIHLQNYGIVYAGPYALRPKDLRGIKLAPEVPGDYDHLMCIKDFGIPSVKEMDLAILTGLKYFQESGNFYVGCMMGQGRTGTFLACFLKVFGYQKPIQEVRQLYNPKAVETQAQEDFVDDYPIEKFEYLVRFLSKNQ